MGATLYPCPLCEDDALLAQVIDDSWWVYCRNDECKCNVGYFDKREDAIVAWQNRPLPNYRKSVASVHELRALVALIERPPLDDVLLERDAALRCAAAIRELFDIDQRIATRVVEVLEYNQVRADEAQKAGSDSRDALMLVAVMKRLLAGSNPDFSQEVTTAA